MRRFLSCVLAGAALLAGTSASASGLQVAPVSIDVPATQNAEGLWLSNTGDTPVRAQVRVFRWTQENDADQLTPTKELLASPPMIELAVGERQLIRAIRLGAPPTGGAEQAYRLIIDELPSEDPARKGLQYVLRYSVPVFVQPLGAPASEPQLQWALQREGDKTLLEVANSGGTHAQLADLTYIWTAQGWLYLAVVLDLYTRRVVGWAPRGQEAASAARTGSSLPAMMADHLRHELTLAALDMAIVRQRPAPGLVHHADRGVQYAAHGYRACLRHHGMVCSMSRKGDCWDNAPASRACWPGFLRKRIDR